MTCSMPSILFKDTCQMAKENDTKNKAAPLPVRSGIDAGKEWKNIYISSEADPADVAYGLKDSFNAEWISKLKELL